jgi:hypothetical protein
MSEGISVRIGVDNAAFKTGLDRCRDYAAEFTGSIGKMFLGAFAVDKVLDGFKQFMEEMAKVADRAKRFGETKEAIQRIGHAAKLAGADMDMVARAITKMTIASGEAASKGGDMGERWKKAGLEAGKFASLSMQDKLIELSEAWGRANGNAEAQLAIMEILGPKGQDLIPMLAEGPEEMRKNYAAAHVAIDATVNSMKQLDDALISLKNMSVAVFGFLVQVVKSILPVAAIVFGDLVTVTEEAIRQIGAGIRGLSAMIGDAMTGNFKGVKDEWAKTISDMSGNHQRASKKISETNKQMIDDLKVTWGYGPKEKPEDHGGVDLDRLREMQEAAKKMEALKAEIAKKDKENALALMAYDEKRAALQKEIADAQAKINDTTVEGLEAKKTALELQGKLAELEKKHAEEQQRVKDDIAGLEVKNAMALMDYEQKRLELQKQIAEEQKKSNDTTTEGLQAKKNAIELQGKLSELEKKHSDDLANAKEQEAKVDEKNALDRMTPEQQRAYRINQQKKLMEESEAAAKRGDDVEAITKRTKAKEIEKDLLPDKEKAKDIKGAVTVSTLRGVGGGGFVGGTQSSDPTLRAAEKGNSYLERITRAVEAQAKGSAVNPAEIMRNNSYPYSKK